MANFREVNDQRVRQLAETLKRNGLAASESEAINMAKSMTTTESQINEVFNRKKDEVIMSTSRQRPITSAPSMNVTSEQELSRSREQEVSAQEVAAQHRQRPAPHPNNAINEAISNVQEVYSQPQRVDLDVDLPPETPLAELMAQEQPPTQEQHETAPQIEEELQTPVYEEAPAPSGAYKEDVPEQPFLDPQSLETEPPINNDMPQFEEAPAPYEQPLEEVMVQQTQEVVEQPLFAEEEAYQEPLAEQPLTNTQEAQYEPFVEQTPATEPVGQEPLAQQPPITQTPIPEYPAQQPSPRQTPFQEQTYDQPTVEEPTADYAQDDEELVEKTVEITQRPAQRRDTSAYAEAKVDLSSVFKFKG